MFKQFEMKRKPLFMIIPMIDIIFFLLVFFMMHSLETVTQKALDVQLPTAQAATIQKQLPIVITLDKAGHLVIEDTPMDFAMARQILAQKVATNPSVAVILQADVGATHGQVVQIMDMVRTVGVKRFSIAARTS